MNLASNKCKKIAEGLCQFVLYRTGNVPEKVYNGRQFPEGYWRGGDIAIATLTYNGQHDCLSALLGHRN